MAEIPLDFFGQQQKSRYLKFLEPKNMFKFSYQGLIIPDYGFFKFSDFGGFEFLMSLTSILSIENFSDFAIFMPRIEDFFKYKICYMYKYYNTDLYSLFQNSHFRSSDWFREMTL